MSTVKPPQVYSKSLNASTWPVLLGFGVYMVILCPNLRIYVYLLYIDVMPLWKWRLNRRIIWNMSAFPLLDRVLLNNATKQPFPCKYPISFPCTYPIHLHNAAEPVRSKRYHQRWRQHRASRWLHCWHGLHCLYCSNCFTLLKH